MKSNLGVLLRQWSLLAVVGGTVVSAEPVHGGSDSAPCPQRIVSCGADLTEIVTLLDRGDSLVGVDDSSQLVGAQKELPRVGYKRALNIEGVLSLRPDLVIATADAGPPHVLQRLNELGIDILMLPEEKTVPGTIERIEKLSSRICAVAEGEELVKPLLDLESPPRWEEPPRVLFIYARGGGVVNVSGRGTAADEMIRLAGAINAVNDYAGYRPMTAEGLISAQPDVILFTDHGLEALGGVEAASRLPGLAKTKAGRNQSIVAVDELMLLGFGPRVDEAVDMLVDSIGSRLGSLPKP